MSEAAPGGVGPRVIVAPLNLGVELSPDLGDAIPIVEQALLAELKQRKARVAVIWPPDATGLWQTCAVAVRSEQDSASDLRTVSRCFAETLGRVEPFDLLLLPSLGLREARVSGRTASWDGVRRRIGPRARVASDSALSSGDTPVFGTTGMAGSHEWSGKISGLSLHLMGFVPGRRTPIEHWGGIDLVHDPVQVRDPVTGDVETQLRPRADMLTNQEDLRTGVTLALDPVWSEWLRQR